MPEIEVNPEEEITKEAERIQKMFEREKWQDDNHNYIPELFGFFTCKEHLGGDLPTGIYVFVNKLERHPVKNVDIAFLTVYYHELTHLAVHNTALHLPLMSNDIQNFEEPFCEYVSYHLTFTKYRERPTTYLRILNREVSIRAPPKSLFIMNDHEKRVIEKAETLFRTLSRPYPYEWFNKFNEIVDVGDVMFKHLILTCLNGTLSSTERIDKPCNRAKVYLIGAGDTTQITQQKLEELFETSIVTGLYEL